MKKIFWGLFFLVAAAAIIVNQLGYYTDINLFSLLCTIFLIPIFITSLFKLQFPGMLFSLAFLAIIYQEPLGIEELTPWPVLFTALLGSIGLSIIFGRSHIYKCCHLGRHHEHFDKIINEEDDENVVVEVNFGSSVKYVNTDDFKSAKLRSSFGALKVYFDNAKIKGDSATIRLDASFSGVEIYIPKEWKIVSKIDTSLGSVDMKNNSNEVTKKTVTLTGSVSLSGVEIFYV